MSNLRKEVSAPLVGRDVNCTNGNVGSSLMSAYLAGELRGNDRRKLERHLRVCLACSAKASEVALGQYANLAND
jgi:hypothetical protein